MKHIMTVLTLVLVAGISRLIPHPWNFTAIGAMALFSGARMPHKAWSFAAPLLSLFWTDAILGFHETLLYVYAAITLITILGFYMNRSWSRVLGGTLASAGIFFILTNFGVWISQDLYPHSMEGLVQCFVMAIPFFKTQILGDLFYSGVLFGSYALLKTFVPSLKLAN